MDIEMIADYQCEIGEGPLWHPLERRLYWVDIPAGRLFRYDPSTNLALYLNRRRNLKRTCEVGKHAANGLGHPGRIAGK